MNKLLIADRLLSENKGIDAIIAFAMKHPELELILVCAKEVKGHRPGQAGLALASHLPATAWIHPVE
jgi:tetrahydromethanopterin S-methyltransferase subunit A